MSTTVTSEAGRVVMARKRRSTGFVVELIDNRKAEEGSPWQIRCVEHDATADRANAKEARRAARAPEGWCPRCKAAARRRAARAAA